VSKVVPPLLVSELFTSLQGEGPSLGSPRDFLRLGGCNLDCAWCDTPYTWDFRRFDRAVELRHLSVEEVQAWLGTTGMPGLVVTGGEPLLQQVALSALLERLPQARYVEVETNGTQRPHAALLQRVDQWNVSPKLASSGIHEARAWHPDILAELAQTQRAWLKLVIADEEELHRAERWVARLGWPEERVVAMAEGNTSQAQRAGATWLVPRCLERGWRYSPRLHVDLWGDARRR